LKRDKVHHEHDVGYKHIFSHKSTFLELIRSFSRKEWSKQIKEEDLILVDKSYILSDFEEEESDILYKANIDNKEVIFYLLLEFQSKVDFQMPMRLLFYMTEIWRDVLKNADKKEKRRKSFKLPAIIPIVLYNGKNKWTAHTSFKEVLSGYELFEDNILDFNYILFDINGYQEKELYEMSNLVSAVFLLDQEMNEQELIRRLRKIIYILKKISPEQFTVFKQWLKKIVKPRLTEEVQKEVDEVLDKSDQEEVEIMVHRLEKTLDNIERRGIEKGKIEVARNFLKMGLSVEQVATGTGLTIEEVRKLKSHIVM